MDALALVLLLKGKTNLSLLLIFTYITLFTTFLLYTYGLLFSFSLYYITLIAFVFITPWKITNKIVYSFSTIVAFSFITVYRVKVPVSSIDDFTVLIFNIANMIFCSISIALIIQHYDQKTRQTQRDLTAMHKAKERLYSIIAHDLRGPIGSVANIADLVYDSIESNEVDDETKKLSKTILKTSAETRDLLENLLSWTKNGYSDMTPELSKIDVLALFDNCIELNRAQIDLKEIKVTFNKKDSYYTKGDEKMIFTVLRNLVSNAIKFSHKGGEIELQVKKANNQVQYSISDNGIGMPAEMVNNAFLINNKKVRPGTNKEHGTGLGLVLCRELIDKNDGKIWIESTPEVGTKVHFELPAYKQKKNRKEFSTF